MVIGLVSLWIALGCSAAETNKFNLLGEWQGKAKNGTIVRYAFKPGGDVVWTVEEPSFKRMMPNGLTAKFTVRETSPLWELDIDRFKDERFGEVTMRAILQPISATSFKMEGKPSNRGERPKAFTDEAIVFERK